MNRLQKKLNVPGKKLSIYVTAGYPNLNDTVSIVKALDQSNVDFIELGMPFSDPMADGPTIQQTSAIALQNGMNLQLYFEQVKEIRNFTQIPLVFMGYYNQILKFGKKRFYEMCKDCGIDALIVPDVPFNVFNVEDKPLLDLLDISASFLITPQTSDTRIEEIDASSNAFVYVVSSNSITGNTSDINNAQMEYFSKIKSLKTKHKKIIGFGIHDANTYQTAVDHADGAIIGSAFLKALKKEDPIGSAKLFVQSIRTV